MKQILVLQKTFENILNINSNVLEFISDVSNIIVLVHNHHITYVKENQDDRYLFAIDSLFFQYKLLNTEFTHYKNLHVMIINRMYCQYYKLHMIILNYIRINNFNYTTTVSFLPYKDIEIIEYSINDMLKIHESILSMLSCIDELINIKTDILDSHIQILDQGLKINNFVSEFSYDTKIIQEKYTMFVSQLSYFHESDSIYLNNLKSNVNLFLIGIRKNITIDNTKLKKH